MSDDHRQPDPRSDEQMSPAAPSPMPQAASARSVEDVDAADAPATRGGVPPGRDRGAPTPIDAELDAARSDVVEVIATWLSAAWEQTILRALSSNADRALDNAAAFPALRRALRDLQSDARRTVEDQVAPLLDTDVVTSEQAVTSSVNAVALELVGLIGAPMKDANLDTHSSGLERAHDGYRLKNMGDHEQIRAAVQTLTALKVARAAERAAETARELEIRRAEVERLWRAPPDL